MNIDELNKEEVEKMVLEETSKSPWETDWTRVKQGLDYLYPTSEEDIMKMERSMKIFFEEYIPKREAQYRKKRNAIILISLAVVSVIAILWLLYQGMLFSIH